MNVDKLNQDEFAFVERTLLEKTQKMKAERERLTKEIEAAENTMKKLGGYAATNGGHSATAVINEDFEIFASIYREANGRFLTRDHVFTQYQLKTRSKLTLHRYKKYLGGNGNFEFKKKGERGSAKWKIVEKATG